MLFMRKVLVTTVYSFESIVKAITAFSIDRLFLMVNEKPNEEQSQAVEQLKKNYEKIVEIKEKKIPIYDVVGVAEKAVDLFDTLSKDDEIIVNITPGRKTQALGILFAAYKRTDRISKIVYFNEDNKTIITLPLLSFDLTESQQKILDKLEETDVYAELAEKTKQSRAMLYRNIKEMKSKGLIEETKQGLQITDAGKIARL